MQPLMETVSPKFSNKIKVEPVVRLLYMISKPQEISWSRSRHNFPFRSRSTIEMRLPRTTRIFIFIYLFVLNADIMKEHHQPFVS
jgi:hypothetical protein